MSCHLKVSVTLSAVILSLESTVALRPESRFSRSKYGTPRGLVVRDDTPKELINFGSGVPKSDQSEDRSGETMSIHGPMALIATPSYCGAWVRPGGYLHLVRTVPDPTFHFPSGAGLGFMRNKRNDFHLAPPDLVSALPLTLASPSWLTFPSRLMATTPSDTARIVPGIDWPWV